MKQEKISNLKKCNLKYISKLYNINKLKSRLWPIVRNTMYSIKRIKFSLIPVD